MLEPNSELAVVSGVTSSGPEVMNVSGIGPVGQRWTAGVGSTLPEMSTARTRSSCDPTNRSRNWWGYGHEPKDGWSRAHSNVTPGSFEAKTKSAVVLRVWLGGPD